MKIIDTLYKSVERMFLRNADNKAILEQYYARSNGQAGLSYQKQAQTVFRKGIEDWRMALMAATDPDNPQRGLLKRFYDNLKMDGHLMSAIENRILPIQCAPFKFVDDNGEEVAEAKGLVEKPWYLDVVRLVLSSIFEGTKLVEMYDLDPDTGELSGVSEIPQTNFIPQRGIVVYNEGEQQGVSYKDGVYKNYYFQVGGDWQLGMLNTLALIILAKKTCMGNWLSYIDKFGVPPIIVTTNRMDDNRRRELSDAMQGWGSGGWLLGYGEETFTVVPTNSGDYNSFKSLMTDIANKEMDQYILGGSGLTDEKSFVGAAEAQERLLKYRHQTDKLLFKFIFNKEILPRLVNLSPVYKPLEGLTFTYDESETLALKDLVQVVKDLSAYYSFDAEELAKMTGLPITGMKRAGGGPAPAERADNSGIEIFRGCCGGLEGGRPF